MPLSEVLAQFCNDLAQADYVVCHNVAFDKKIVGAELYRIGEPDILEAKPSICTMERGTAYCKIRSNYGYKWPTLQELHHKLFGVGFEDAHNSLVDVNATVKCFWEMRRRKLV